MKEISVINPETYTVDAIRLLMYKGAGFQAVAGDFIFIAALTGVMVALAVAAFLRGL